MKQFRWACGFLAVEVLLNVALAACPSKLVAAAGIPDYRFGVVEAQAAPNSASALGAGWTRVTFPWNEIQRNGPDEWNTVTLTDQALATELSQGRQVVGLLVTTPGWATDSGRGAGVPQGLYLPVDDPQNTWATFVREIVTRYAGRVDHWIIWNEPDIPASSPDVTWGGSVEDYVQLLRVAYIVAKQANGNAVIHLAAITHYHNEGWFDQFLRALTADPGAAAHNYFFDVASLNLYHEPEKIYDITVHYYDMLRGYGLHKPFWITETNAYLSRVSPEQQAMFIPQAFSLEIAAGVQRIAIYKMIDAATDKAADPEPFGLVQQDGVRRPAFTAYRVATSYLSGFRAATWERRDDLSVVVVDRGSRTTTVVWARTPEPQTAMIPARTTNALLVDTWGAARYIYPERGYYFIDLPGADCTNGCQMGGAPFMVVEDAPANAETASPPASPTPAQAVEKGTVEADLATEQAPTNTSTPTPTSTPTATSTWIPSPTRVPSATASATTRPTTTPTPVPTATCTAAPEPAATLPPPPTSTPPFFAMSQRVRERPWPLAGGLALALLGGVIVVALRRSRENGGRDLDRGS